jgi:GABA permease
VNSSGAIIAVIYLAIAVSQVRTRRAREAAGRPPPTLPMWLFPWLSYVGIAGMLAVLVAMAVTPSHRAEFWTSVISMAVTLAAFVFFRLLPSRRGVETLPQNLAVEPRSAAASQQAPRA